MANPGPANTTTPNAIGASFVESGTSTLYTFATLPAASNFTIGYLAETSDQGMCHVVLVNGVNTWAVLGIPQSGGAVGRYMNVAQGLTALTAPGQGSLSLQYQDVPWPVTATRMDFLASIAAQSTTTTNTAAVAISAYGGIYSNSASTLTLLSSGSTQTTYSYASNNSGQTQLLAGAIRPISIPINVSMTPGEYYVAFNISTSQSSVGAATTALNFSISAMGYANVQSALNYAEFTAVTTANSGLYGAHGIWSSAQTGLPSTIPVTQINQTGANQSAAQYGFVLRNY